MSYTYELYGISATSLAHARAIVERALGLVFAEQESSYHGGVYFRHSGGSDEIFMLKSNVDDVEGDLFEPRYGSFDFLLYVERTNRPEVIRKLIEATGRGVWLRAEIVD